jgi:hypothetical protein
MKILRIYEYSPSKKGTPRIVISQPYSSLVSQPIISFPRSLGSLVKKALSLSTRINKGALPELNTVDG